MKFSAFLFLLTLKAFNINAQQNDHKNVLQFIFTSDAHYGIKRKMFRNDSAVDSHIVNVAMIQEMNKLPKTMFPPDEGVNAGDFAGSIDYIIRRRRHCQQDGNS